jgi:hypothetical protein
MSDIEYEGTRVQNVKAVEATEEPLRAAADGGAAGSEQDRILGIVHRVLVEGVIPHSLHDAYAQIERAVRGEG